MIYPRENQHWFFGLYSIIADEIDLVNILNVLQSDLEYENFKNMVGRHEDQRDKLDAYHKIWSVMYNYQNKKQWVYFVRTDIARNAREKTCTY